MMKGESKENSSKKFEELEAIKKEKEQARDRLSQKQKEVRDTLTHLIQGVINGYRNH